MTIICSAAFMGLRRKLPVPSFKYSAGNVKDNILVIEGLPGLGFGRIEDFDTKE